MRITKEIIEMLDDAGFEGGHVTLKDWEWINFKLHEIYTRVFKSVHDNLHYDFQLWGRIVEKDVRKIEKIIREFE